MDELIKYQKELSETVKEWDEDAVFIFRGQKNHNWELESSANRRLKNPNQGGTPNLLEYLNKSLIEPARNKGHSYQQNKELNDLELLARLQHRGASTCLIDFTTNFHIALWFACEEDSNNGKDKNNHGKVFIINLDNNKIFKEITPDKTTKNIKKLFKNQVNIDKKELYENKITTNIFIEDSYPIYYWEPPLNKNRIIAQQSCFIFSAQAIKKSIYKEITIHYEDKEKIKKSLEKYCGLEEQNIFKDFTGFANSHSQDKPIKHKNSKQWFQSGNKYLRQRNHKAAIKDYNRAIDLNPEFTKAYLNRGHAKSNSGKHEEAIMDFDQVIKLDPGHIDAYFMRGIAQFFLEKFKEAITDFGQVTEFDPEHTDAYFMRGIAQFFLEKFKEAITDFGQVTEFDSEHADAYFMQGIAKSFLKQYSRAIKDLKHAKILAKKQGRTELLQATQKELNKLKPNDEDP